MSNVIQFPAADPTLTVEFDAEAHAYYVGGERWPSVTQILSGIGLGYDFSSEKAMARGRFIHAALHQAFQRIYDRRNEIHRGYIEAGLAFIEREGFVSVASERIVLLPGLKVCGTLDRYGYFKRWPDKPVIVDWKSGDIPPWTALQLAAYDIGIDPKNTQSIERIGVRLYEDGAYDTVRYSPDSLKTDRVAFAAAVNLYRWREQHGLLREAA